MTNEEHVSPGWTLLLTKITLLPENLCGLFSPSSSFCTDDGHCSLDERIPDLLEIVSKSRRRPSKDLAIVSRQKYILPSQPPC